MEVIKETLPNGVTLLIKPTEGLGIVSVATFIRGGILDEPLNGLTRLTIYMLLKGSKHYKKEQISATFEDFGGGIATVTHTEFSVIEFSTKVEGLKKGLAVLRDMLENPLFPEQDLEREKKNTITAIKSKKEKPFQYAYSELKKITYGGTPYANDVLGEEESVSKIRREDLVKRWEQLKEGGRFVVSLVGDINDTKETLKWLEETFEWLPKKGFSYPNYDKKVVKNELKILQREGSQATILCAFNAPNYKGEDYYAGKVFNAVLGDGFTSLLFRELREKRGYAYATTSFYPTSVNMPRLFTYIGTSPEKSQNALEDMLKVTESFPFKEEDVEVAKRKIVGEWLMDHQTRARQAWYLGWFETVGLGYETDKFYTERIKAVSFDEVIKIREQYIDHLHHCVMVRP